MILQMQKFLFPLMLDSIHTGNEQRDGHLKSDDFFNAAEVSQNHFSINGD